MNVRDRAPKHKHDAAQNAALRMCVICANVTMHDAQCKRTGPCKVGSCWSNQKGA